MSTSPMLSNRVHTKYEVRNGVAIIKLDSPNSKVNTLNTEVMTEMKELFEILEKDPNVKASVLISGEWLDKF
jgi:enoyl-CoA hydratase / long-chain 3-hydroxyacyl-CoA dehydrogenase